MADIKYNTMRFLTDEFNPYVRQALLVSNEPINLTNFNQIDQITVLGNEPEGSKRRFMFKMDNKVYKFSGSNAVEYTGDVTLSNVLANGNTASELESVRGNRTLVGKNIYPIIALYTTTQDAPSAKLTFAASLVQEVLDKVVEHTATTFGGDATILGFTWDTTIVGNASVVFRLQLRQNGTWTDYMTITEARGQTADAMRVKFIYHVDAVDGNNAATSKKFNALISKDVNFLVYGDVAYIISNTKYCVRNLSGAVLVVRHEDLDGGSLDADVSYQVTRVRTTGVALGNATGAEQTFTLTEDIFPWSIALYVGGTKTTDFEFDTADRSIKLLANAANNGKAVTIDYMYNRTDEVWQPMTRDLVQPTGDGYYATRFALANPLFDSENLTTALIRIKLNRGKGTSTVKKTGNGSEQVATLSHVVDDVSCDAPDWYLDYEDDTAKVHFTAPSGQAVKINYSWHGKTPVVLGWDVVYSA